MKAAAARLLPIALSLVLAGCASSLVDYSPRVHIVQPGETLYAIADRYRLDYRDLARWNRLENPNMIQVGQRIRLTPPAAQPPVQAAVRRAPASAPTRASATVAAAPPPRPRAAAAPSARPAPTPDWRWPTEGDVVSTFGAETGIAGGIGIGGRVGQPVEAAAAGRVVYAGDGLIGYGQLVIIQHNDTYLTAYGHNRRLLVEKGQYVARGQKIAEMGLGPGRRPRLHFEIRRNGQPVDPLRYMAPPADLARDP